MSRFKTSENADPNYLASVVELKDLRPHSNADRLQVATVFGNSCIVDLSAKLGDKYIYFPVESALNCRLLSFNNLYEHTHLNYDPEKKGYFGDKGRVKTTRLRGEASQGFLLKLGSFQTWLYEEGINLDDEDFLVGTDFDTIGDIVVLTKYVPKRTQQQGEAREPKTKKNEWSVVKSLLPNQFRFHRKTLQFGRFADLLNPKDMVTITEKLHGTSAVFSNVLVNRKLAWWEKLAAKFGAKIPKHEYAFIYSSRNSHKNRRDGEWTKDVWGQWAQRIAPNLPNGFTIYGEIVGFQDSGRYVQSNYDYGCKVGENEFYAYRVTYTDAHGDVLELDFQGLQDFCSRRSLKVVPLHYHGRVEGIAGDGKALLAILSKDYLDKPCVLCKSGVVNEGVVVRLESKIDKPAFKFKSVEFCKKESESRDRGETNIEEE